jgi:hypothetical protein
MWLTVLITEELSYGSYGEKSGSLAPGGRQCRLSVESANICALVSLRQQVWAELCSEVAVLLALEHIKHTFCLLVGSFVRSTTRGQGGHIIPSVRLRIRTGFGRNAMFLISPYGLALWFANTGCWCEPDSRFEKDILSKLNPSVRWCEQ